MKRTFLFCILCVLALVNLRAQEEPLGDPEETFPNDALENIWDIDSLFDDVPEEIPEIDDNAPINLRDKILLEASYGFIAGFSPGWSEVPWYNGNKDYDFILGAKMDAKLSIDLPLTDHLRVYNSFSFSLPDSAIFSIKELYFEFNLRDKAFIKAGLYEVAWGISRFYPFTNLPSLVPKDRGGDAYTLKVAIPVGVGGFELLGMTRGGFMGDPSSPQFDEFSYGLKYNLAMEAVDIDTGFLYHEKLPVRFFVSAKTTLGNTEIYSEGLVAISQNNGKDAHFSGNFGFLQDFFKGKLTLIGEVFYNGEPDTVWWRPETDLLEKAAVDLYQGFNSAFAFVIRPGFLGMRIFGQILYTHKEESAWLIPGISIKPGSITFSVSTPMALGRRTVPDDSSNYYRNNTDENNRPFSIILGINFSGKRRYTF